MNIRDSYGNMHTGQAQSFMNASTLSIVDFRWKSKEKGSIYKCRLAC